MSYNSLAIQVQDTALMSRVDAAVHQEAIENPEASASDFGVAVRNGSVLPAIVFGWPVSVATEEEYAYALDAGTPNPGGDPTVITDPMILAAVQANWPAEWPPPSTGIPLMRTPEPESKEE